MDANTLLSRHAGYIKSTLESLDLKFTMVEQTDQCKVFEFVRAFGSKSRFPCYIIISSGLVSSESFHLMMTAILDRPLKLEKNLNSLAAFLHQLSAVLPPLSFMLDFQSRQVLIRQCLIGANDSKSDLYSFLNIVQLIIPMLEKTLVRLESGQFTEQDARLMADYLSDSNYSASSD